MAKYWFCLTAIVFCAVMGLHASAKTGKIDAQALQDLYGSLNRPQQLLYWRSVGGDPCGESWLGVQCTASSIIHIKLHGLGLTGNLGFHLSNLTSLKHLDLSSNEIDGAIPYNLPPNLTYLNLAGNKLNDSIPYNLENLNHLQHLNLSHNLLSGPLGDMFSGLENIREMDLSFNHLTEDLPPSFRTLANLRGLFLQSNQFTGSVIFLSNLTLSDLNIDDNHFSGVIPQSFENIPNLRMWGNEFGRETNYPPWSFPSETTPGIQNIHKPPSANLSAFESHPSPPIIVGHKKQHGAGILLMIGGFAVLAACAAAIFVAIHKNRSRGPALGSLGDCEDSTLSLNIGTAQDYTSMTALHSSHSSPFSSSPLITPSRLPPIRTKTIRMPRRTSFTKKGGAPIGAKVYTIEELQTATNSFSEENLIGGGSLGNVYRAEFPDGTILAVKNVQTIHLSIVEEQQFLDVIRNASRLRHPNIVSLLGYCTEYGQHLIVHEFVRTLSLHQALHCVTYKPLSWGLRLRIALGVARALKYMHSTCVPPIAHGNIKAANVLLDDELMPRVSDCGLAILRPLITNQVKLKASEMAIADSGYIAPEHDHPGTGNTKADIYAFGVLLLELLTGRKPFDNSRPRAEQSLVRWASCKLHDSASLRQMVDPALSRTASSNSLSRYADIVSLCIQPEQGFRPTMSIIVESILSLVQKPNAISSKEAEHLDRSLQSTNGRFFASPSLSYYSV